MAVLEPDRASELDPGPADQAGDVGAAVEHRGEVACRVVDLHREHRVALDRADLDDPDLPLHRDLAAGDGADGGDAARGDRAPLLEQAVRGRDLALQGQFGRAGRLLGGRLAGYVAVYVAGRVAGRGGRDHDG